MVLFEKVNVFFLATNRKVLQMILQNLQRYAGKRKQKSMPRLTGRLPCALMRMTRQGMPQSLPRDLLRLCRLVFPQLRSLYPVKKGFSCALFPGMASFQAYVFSWFCSGMISVKHPVSGVVSYAGSQYSGEKLFHTLQSHYQEQAWR
jgi:hypothetical protein